jgi:ABC-type spermidine/putrescine transport system permease subunit I
MRHNRVIARRVHRRAFRRAFLTAAIVTAAAAVLGFAIAFSPLAGWVTMGLAAAVAATLWVESRSGRAASDPPVTRVYFLGQQGNN